MAEPVLTAPSIGNPLLPDGKTLGYGHQKGTPLTDELLGELSARFEAVRGNIETFYHGVIEGEFLARMLEITSSKSFMAQALSKVKSRARSSNSWTELLHGSDTKHHMVSQYLPWTGILFDFFSSTPIPENQEAIGRGNASLDLLKDIADNDRDFYDSTLRGVRVPKLGSEAPFTITSAPGLEFVVMANNQPIRPEIVSPDWSTISVGDRTLYNGLPKDRGKFPTMLLEEGAQVGVKVSNTSNDRLYLVVPTINGIPMHLDDVILNYRGFENTPLPLTKIFPLMTYIKPGEEKTFDRLHVNRIGISSNDVTEYASSDDIHSPDSEEFAYILGRLFEQNISDENRRLLEKCKDPHLQRLILHGSLMGSSGDFLKYLNQAKASDIFISKPVVADDKLSSELDNPMLGTLGFSVVAVTPAPVEAKHDYRLEFRGASQFGGSPMKGGGTMGLGGLATIAGGADTAAKRTDFWDTYRHHDMIHRFAGYVPLNLMSLK
jgi:hypothetical protein